MAGASLELTRVPAGRAGPDSVAVIGSEHAFAGLDRRLRDHGVTLHRVGVLRTAAWPPGIRRLEAEHIAGLDLLVVTSREVVRALAMAPSVLGRMKRSRRFRVFAVGPGTALELRRIGLEPKWTGTTGGSTAIVVRLQGSRPLRILYPRSARAGPALARALRRQGHSVRDPIVYRHAPPARLPRRLAEATTRAGVVVVTSPSALCQLRAGLDPATFQRVRARPGLVVLGERSARSARGHGFRGVRISPTTAEQDFTRFLLRELRGGDQR